MQSCVHTYTYTHMYTEHTHLYVHADNLLSINTVVILIHMNTHTLMGWMCRVGGVNV